MKQIEPVTRQAFGQWLKRLRLRKGWTLEEAQRYADIPAGTMSRLERGLQNYTEDMLTRLATGFAVPLAEVRTRAGAPVVVETERGSVATDPLTGVLDALARLPSPWTDDLTALIYGLIARLADDRQRHWEHRITAAWEQSGALADRAIVDEAITPAELLELRYQICR